MEALKITHNGEFCQKSGLDWLKMANFGPFADFPIFSPKMMLRLTWIGQFHLICRFPSFDTRASYFWRNLKNFYSMGGIHDKYFEFFNFF